MIQPSDKEATGARTTWNSRDGNWNYVEIDGEFIVKATADMPQYNPDYWEQ